jgi:hypothetical protein
MKVFANDSQTSTVSRTPVHQQPRVAMPQLNSSPQDPQTTRR